MKYDPHDHRQATPFTGCWEKGSLSCMYEKGVGGAVETRRLKALFQPGMVHPGGSAHGREKWETRGSTDGRGMWGNTMGEITHAPLLSAGPSGWVCSNQSTLVVDDCTISPHPATCSGFDMCVVKHTRINTPITGNKPLGHTACVCFVVL